MVDRFEDSYYDVTSGGGSIEKVKGANYCQYVVLLLCLNG